jgi:surfactin synthase thioesterase subunit
MQLFCLPYAGAGASMFQTWPALAPDGLRLRPVQLPGREERLDEQPHTNIHAAIRALVPELVYSLDPPVTVALFGHSLGAVLAYELARAMSNRQGVTVAHLFVSGSPGPRLGRSERASGLSDDEFLDRVLEFAGYRHPAFDIPELRELILPTLRADVELHEGYTPLSNAPLNTPITCFRGRDDRLVSRADAFGWRDCTTIAFDLVEPPGGHMFLVDDPSFMLSVIDDRLSVPHGEWP